jgi:PBSX family phage portal protein
MLSLRLVKREGGKAMSMYSDYRPQKKARVFVYTSERRLIKAEELKKYEIKKDSKQIKQEEILYSERGIVSPPFPPESFLNLLENNVYFDRCVRRIAEDACGLGWHLALKEGEKENEAEREKAEKFLLTQKPSLEEILIASLVDYLSIGWLAIEVVRNLQNEPEEIYHVPAHTLKVHKSGKKFLQRRNTREVWFKAFKEEGDISKTTGEEGTFDIEERANELIFKRNYYSRSSYYGAPPILSAVGSVIGLIGIRDFNLAFFENYGIPAALVVLKGEWEEGSEQRIREFIDTQIKGSEKAHKTVVCSVDESSEIKWIPIENEVKEGSFRILHKTLRDEVLTAYSMPPYRIGIAEVGSLGGTTAQEATKVYVQTVIRHHQKLAEGIINSLLEERQIKNYVFKFEKIDVRDLDAEVNRCVKLFSVGAISPNQIRQRLGIGEPYEGGDRYYISKNYMPIEEAEIEKSEEFLDTVEALRDEVRRLLNEEIEERES